MAVDTGAGALAEAHPVLHAMRATTHVQASPSATPELRARVEALLRRADMRRRPGRLRVGALEVDAAARWCACAARRSSFRRRSSRSRARWRPIPRACSPRTSCCARSGAFARWAVTVVEPYIADGARRPNPRRTRRCRLPPCDHERGDRQRQRDRPLSPSGVRIQSPDRGPREHEPGADVQHAIRESCLAPADATERDNDGRSAGRGCGKRDGSQTDTRVGQPPRPTPPRVPR